VYDQRRVEGTIVAIDRFGNCITDIERSRIPFAKFAMQKPAITRVSTTYSGEGPFLIIGSTGCVEISVAGASAAALLQLERGDRMTIVPL
jgi:S-adenosylmethionine hydrolase